MIIRKFSVYESSSSSKDYSHIISKDIDYISKNISYSSFFTPIFEKMKTKIIEEEFKDNFLEYFEDLEDDGISASINRNIILNLESNYRRTQYSNPGSCTLKYCIKFTYENYASLRASIMLIFIK